MEEASTSVDIFRVNILVTWYNVIIMARKTRTSGRIYLHLAAHLRSGAGPHGPGHKASRRLDRYATEEQLDELDDSDDEFEEEVKYHTELLCTFRRELHKREESYDMTRYHEWADDDRIDHQRELLEGIDEMYMSIDEEIKWFEHHQLLAPAVDM